MSVAKVEHSPHLCQLLHRLLGAEVAPVNDVDAVGRRVSDVLVHEAAKAAEVGGHTGDTHHCALSWKHQHHHYRHQTEHGLGPYIKQNINKVKAVHRRATIFCVGNFDNTFNASNMLRLKLQTLEKGYLIIPFICQINFIQLQTFFF